MTTAIATSLDAMAVGVGLAFLQVNIIATALAIGCATLIMSTLGMMVGRFIGPLLGKRAEILGGIVLIRLAAKFCLCCQRFPHLWFCPPRKRRHLQ